MLMGADGFPALAVARKHQEVTLLLMWETAWDVQA